MTQDCSPLARASLRKRPLLLAIRPADEKPVIDVGQPRSSRHALCEAIDLRGARAPSGSSCSRCSCCRSPAIAASTNASALDAVFAAARAMRLMPALRGSTPSHDTVISSRCAEITTIGSRTAGRTSSSFFLACRDVRSISEIDHATATDRGCSQPSWGSSPEQYAVTFQSRFGRAVLKLYQADAGRSGGGDPAGRRRCPGCQRLSRYRRRSRRRYGEFLRPRRRVHAIPCLTIVRRDCRAADLAMQTRGLARPPPDHAARG